MTLRLICVLALASAACSAAVAQPYKAEYRAVIQPQAGVIEMELKLSGERLPSRLSLSIDPKRHRDFTSTDNLQVEDNTAIWRPKGKFSRLRWRVTVNHERAPGRYDSYMTPAWAVFRGDKLVPRATVKAARGLASQASLQIVAPEDWSVITPYAPIAENLYEFDDPMRRFDRPQGWMLAGNIGMRSETIAGVQTIVAAPAGEKIRRQDALAFLNWNLPHLLRVFDRFPQRVLIVTAGDPMWRGGLSGPASLFLHADRPLISENRTSTLLHEFVHIAMGVRGDHESDWIVEGLAEYYSLETLRRSGGVSEQRYREALERMRTWARRAPTLFAPHSNGPITARAVIALHSVDAEMRAATNGKASLDDLATRLARQRGEISLALVQKHAAEVAGRPLLSLQRETLIKPIAAPTP